MSDAVYRAVMWFLQCLACACRNHQMEMSLYSNNYCCGNDTCGTECEAMAPVCMYVRKPGTIAYDNIRDFLYVMDIEYRSGVLCRMHIISGILLTTSELMIYSYF